ncbi:MAG: glycosyltransferase family 39 protein [Bryobacterales bacterium]|nr:glycosyltransferase family 39 protein [Bryobacterales bacterium]
MLVTRNSKDSRNSRVAARSRGASASLSTAPLVVMAVALAAISAAAVWEFYSRGHLLDYGDALAHLNISRRIIDSRTPGPEQIGTVWLPLPHLLMLPFAANDFLWRTGLAGSIPAALCFFAAGLFLFAAARRLFGGNAAGAAAALCFALNPNALYLQSIAMTEAFLFAALLGLLYFAVLFRQTQRFYAVVMAGAVCCTATLVRYEGWFLIPFAAVFFFFTARGRRLKAAAVFGCTASLGPLLWLAHNGYYYSNFLEFYNGPYSAKAIYQRALDGGMARYPGDHDWTKAWLYFWSAAQLCLGRPLFWLGLAGVVAALFKRAWWALALLALPPLFYVLSLYSSGTPIFVPHLWPNSYYNTRYGLAAFPFACLAAAAIVGMAPVRARKIVAAAVVLVSVSPWLMRPEAGAWVCWKESQVNSEARRAWTHEAAAFFEANYRPGDGIFVSFGDLTGIFAEAGIPLRETLHDGNGPLWLAATKRPDLFGWQQWAVAISGDVVSNAIQRVPPGRVSYVRVKTIKVKGAPAIEIYRRAKDRGEAAVTVRP